MKAKQLFGWVFSIFLFMVLMLFAPTPVVPVVAAILLAVGFLTNTQNSFQASRRSFATFAAAIALLFVVGILFIPHRAFAQPTIQPTKWEPLTNAASLRMNGSTTNTLTGSVIIVRKSLGLAVMPLFSATNAAANETVTFRFQVSADGTNYSTHSGLNASFPLTGTTGVRGYTNFSPDLLNNVRYVRLAQIANGHTNSVWVTNVVYSYFN